MKDFYESKVWRFHKIANPYKLIRLQNSLEFLTLKSTDLVLDAGCGGDDYTKILPKTSTIIAIDLSKGVIKNAKENLQSANIFFIVAGVGHLPLKDGSLSKIVCVDVIEHIVNVEKCLREMARVLKPFGKISIFTACGNNRLSLEYILASLLGKLITLIRLKTGHIQLFTTSNLRKLFEPRFVIRSMQYMHHWMGWCLKFLWNTAHLKPSEGYHSSPLLKNSVSSTFSRAFWLILEAEYRLLKNKSLGSEIIINAIKKIIITVQDFLVRKSEVLNKVSIRVIMCENLY